MLEFLARNEKLITKSIRSRLFMSKKHGVNAFPQPNVIVALYPKVPLWLYLDGGGNDKFIDTISHSKRHSALKYPLVLRTSTGPIC